MKFVFEISIISLCFLITNAQAFGQSANSSSGDEQMMNYAQAGVSAGVGGYMIHGGMAQVTQGQQMIQAASPYSSAPGLALVSQGHIQEAMGAMMVSAGLADLGTAAGRSADTTPTDAGLGLPTGYNGLGSTVPPAVQAAVDSGVAAANGAGIDPTDPASLAAAAQGAGLDSGGGMSAGLSKLSPEALAGMEKEKEALMNQFHISSVGTEGGGGGMVAKGNKSDDMASLLASLSGDKNGRGPASVDGLSKMFNGDAIGVAGDNIFKQVTRRYQAKILQKTFLSN